MTSEQRRPEEWQSSEPNYVKWHYQNDTTQSDKSQSNTTLNDTTQNDTTQNDTH